MNIFNLRSIGAGERPAIAFDHVAIIRSEDKGETWARRAWKRGVDPIMSTI